MSLKNVIKIRGLRMTFSPRSVRKAAAGAMGAGALTAALLFGGAPVAQAAPSTPVISGPAHVIPERPGGGHGGGHGGGSHGGGGWGGHGGGGWGHGGWGHGGWGPGWGNGGWDNGNGWGWGWGHRPWWNWWW